MLELVWDPRAVANESASCKGDILSMAEMIL